MFNLGVFAIIFDSDKKILLCHRRDYDLWNLPGGTLEAGETVEQGIIWEVKEETGLDVVVEKLVGVYAKKEKNEVVFSFLCRVVSGDFILNSEADKIEYFDFESIPKNFSPKQRERIEDYLNNPNIVHYKLQPGKSSIELLKENKL